MLPAQAPLPTDSSFPFQVDDGPDVGIQTSILMSESLVGFSVAATRQIAGKFPKFGAGKPGNAGTAPAGNASCPAGTDCANVTVECGRASLARLSQVPARSSGQESAITTTRYRMSYIRTALRPACNVRYAVGSQWNYYENGFSLRRAGKSRRAFLPASCTGQGAEARAVHGDRIWIRSVPDQVHELPR